MGRWSVGVGTRRDANLRVSFGCCGGGVGNAFGGMLAEVRLFSLKSWKVLSPGEKGGVGVEPLGKSLILEDSGRGVV